MAKKKKAPGGSTGAPAWMATFSDLMNLLLCFFVLLFSMSSVDAEKFQQVIASLQSSFSILPAGGATIGEGEMVGSGISQLKELDVYFNEAMATNSNGDGSVDGNTDFVKEFEKASLEESEKISEEIEEQLKQQGISDLVNINFNASFVQLTLSGALLFDSGKAEIKTEAKEVIRKIGQIIQKYNNNIIEIEGHTDNVPMNTSKFPSNDVLSGYRALSVADYLREVSKVNNKYLKYSGRGEYNPIADNSTPEGRAKNRRVEIKIYNSFLSNN